uniref:Protein-glutamine gamma-glutamyltransferase 2 n=1 Tax=Fundulus heteroclitus TaxID=8078 RepID=A0A3Q2QIK0_FUNHE
SLKELIVRRGQPFKFTLKLAKPFKLALDELIMTVKTGDHPSEDLGTMSRFGVPDKVQRLPSAKAVWKAELQRSTAPETGILTLSITPSVDSPVGEYTMSARLGEEERALANLSVLFNPLSAFCVILFNVFMISTGDMVFMPDEVERKEYVMNEQGIIYKGVDNYIAPIHWDYGQFEQDMVSICVKILDCSIKHKQDPAKDVSARCNAIYVSRVITSMINSENEGGILKGNWGNDFRGGVSPTHWSSSYPILKNWFNACFCSVKYGQCWVFSGVMCSVMRLLGIPCRVITNYQSAHDTNKNLIIETYFADYGVREKDDRNKVWVENYHVWVEGWMRRPDLAKDGRYDGWQVLDPTPQEKSDGMFCCGPAPVSAVRNGDTHLKYDVPFVFAEVNADCITWLVKRDGSQVKIHSEDHRIGQSISTKAIGTSKRMDITNSYKQKEGGRFFHIYIYFLIHFFLFHPDLIIPILVPYSRYQKLMIDCESMNISAMVTDQRKKNHVFLAENRIVLMNPPIVITVSTK